MIRHAPPRNPGGGGSEKTVEELQITIVRQCVLLCINIGTGLRLLEEHKARIRALQAALDEGDASGSPEPLDLTAFKAELRARRTG